MRTRIAIILVQGVVLNSSVARAQLAGAVDVGSGLGQVGSNAWLRESRVSPALRLTHPAGFLYSDGTIIESSGAFMVQRAAVDGAINAPTMGPFRLSLAGNHVFGSGRVGVGSPGTSLSISSALSAKFGSSGAWLGTSRETGLLSSSARSVDLGVWRVFRSAVFSISNQSQSLRVAGSPAIWDSTYNDTTGGWNKWVRSGGTASRVARWSDVEARVDWAQGRLALSAAISGRRSRDSVQLMTWSRVNAALQVTSSVSLIAGGGTLPSASASGPATARFATLGLRLSKAAFLRPPLPTAIRPSATAFAAHLVTPGTYRLTLRVPSARTVELSGDFNQWTPIALRETSPNIWEATIALTPGTHRVNVRIDGEKWTAPPGLPAIDDDFSGRVGILILR